MFSDPNPILTVAFVITITAFFKKQLKLTGKWALLCAFLVALIISFIPLLAAQFPEVAPWLQSALTVIVLFLTASGSYDLAVDIRNKIE